MWWPPAPPWRFASQFRARDRGGSVAKERPALRDVGEQLRSILESRAADDPGRLSRACKSLERRDDEARAHAAGKTVAKTNMCLGNCSGVFITEEIGD
jgi:hypothetical protein